MGAARTGIILTLLVAAHALPRGERANNFVGEGTNELATAILQGYVDTDTNLAFSPLGYSTLLAILAEGAAGETRQQLVTALHLPTDPQAIRDCYRSVLERLREKNVVNRPELRNFFYVYKNFSVEQTYQDILHEHYLTEVKNVDRPGSNFVFQLGRDSVVPVIKEQDEDDTKTLSQGAILEESMALGGMKEGALIEQAIKEDSTKADVATESNKESELEEPKPEENPIPEKKPLADELKLPAETPAPEESPIPEQLQVSEAKPILLEDKPIAEKKPEKSTIQDVPLLYETPILEEKPIPVENKPVLEEEQVSEETPKPEEDSKSEEKPMSENKPIPEESPEKKQEEKETMVTSGRSGRGLLAANDVTSGLSGNNLVIKNSNNTTSQMIVFNGMYFRGSWATPFVRQDAAESAFYTSDVDKKAVSSMRAQGDFRIGSIADLDSVALELPYEGERYSLLVLLPNSRTGLRKLISDLTGYSLRNLDTQLTQKEVEVVLPCFEIETITKPIQALGKFGVNDVFSQSSADLSGISKDSGLFVQELVQLVTLRVDDSSSKTSQLTTSSLESRSGAEKFVADHPYLYFVRDVVDNLVVVAGKVMDPSQPPDQYN